MIITKKSFEKQLHNVLTDKSVPIDAKLEYVAIPDNEDEGTADSLRRVEDRIKVRKNVFPVLLVCYIHISMSSKFMALSPRTDYLLLLSHRNMKTMVTVIY